MTDELERQKALNRERQARFREAHGETIKAERKALRRREGIMRAIHRDAYEAMVVEEREAAPDKPTSTIYARAMRRLIKAHPEAWAQTEGVE